MLLHYNIAGENNNSTKKKNEQQKRINVKDFNLYKNIYHCVLLVNVGRLQKDVTLSSQESLNASNLSGTQDSHRVSFTDLPEG